MRGSKIFSGVGGGGVQARRPENSLDNVFFLFIYFRPQLIYTVYGLIIEKTILSKDPEGSNIFQGGGGSNLFHGGPNANFYRNP